MAAGRYLCVNADVAYSMHDMHQDMHAKVLPAKHVRPGCMGLATSALEQV